MKPYRLILELPLENDDQARRLLEVFIHELESLVPELRHQVVTRFEREEGASK